MAIVSHLICCCAMSEATSGDNCSIVDPSPPLLLEVAESDRIVSDETDRFDEVIGAFMGAIIELKFLYPLIQLRSILSFNFHM